VSILAKKYVADGETAVLIWKTDVIDADSMKDFISNFEYKGVKKLFFIAEDIGGVEVEDARIASKSSLLSLLDNQEKTFTIPTLIIATTNFPGMFLANIANRPQRFDDKIKMDYPSSEARKELFKFIGKDRVTNEDIEYVAESKFKQFTPAHLQEIVIRSAIYEQAIKKTMDDMVEEIEQYNKGYTDRNSVGIR
jgi:SpoVK/Ycf46/Vps4 family AAA+-type ATPase